MLRLNLGFQICLFVASVILLTVIIPPLALTPCAHEPNRQDTHRSMFQIGQAHEMPIYDPRLSVSTLYCSLIKDQVVVDGDLRLGTEMQVHQRSWKQGVQTAKATAQRDEGRFLDRFNQAEREKIKTLAKQDPNNLPAENAKDAAEQILNVIDALKPLQNLRKPGAPASDQAHAFVIFAGASGEFLWPSGVISFVIASNDPGKELVRQAMEHWTKKTGCITFQEYTPGVTKDFVQFVRGDGCWSDWVGKKGGKQTVTLSEGCRLPQVIHEIGHVIGLFHEHNRHDRATKLKILDQHVEASYRTQFTRSPLLAEDMGRMYGEFDWKSIMLYPPNAFSKDGRPTMVRIGDETNLNWGLHCGPDIGGVTEGLSAGDVAAVQRLYAAPKKEPAPEKGFAPGEPSFPMYIASPACGCPCSGATCRTSHPRW